MNKYLIFASLLVSTLTIVTLKKDQMGSNYQIGTISDLYFTISDRIFFKSDDNTFGFISQLDGSILEAFELENDQKLLRHSENAEIFLTRNKTINIFTPKDGKYSSASINSFLKRTNFTQIIDFISANSSAFILTDQYLMKAPIILQQNNQYKPINTTQQQVTNAQEILIKFNDKNEQLNGLIQFYNWRIRQVDYYISSIVRQENTTNMCFRIVSNLNQSALCMPIPMNESIVDVVTTSTFIYVYFEDYSLAFTVLMEFVKKVDSKPLQPFKGFLSLGDSHKYFDPVSRTIYDTKIIVEYPISQGKQFKTMKVEEKQLIVQSGDKQIVKISKVSEQNPRKVWSYIKDTKSTTFRLYVQFESGRLVCYQINSENNSYQQIWELLETVDINQNKVPSSGNNQK